MRFLFVLLAFLSFKSRASTACHVFVPEKEFFHAGLVINFDFHEILSAKSYTEVYTIEEADYVLRLNGTEREGRFHRADTVLELASLVNGSTHSAKESVVCITQLCSIGDFTKSFGRSYKQLKKSLPACQ